MKRFLPRSPARVMRALVLLSFTLALIGATTEVVGAQILKEIYFTDGGTGLVAPFTPGKISRVNPDGSSLTDLYTLNGGNTSRPRGIAVDPVNGHIYWNDWRNEITERSNLDGTGASLVLNHL